jgi:hypothetical protein
MSDEPFIQQSRRAQLYGWAMTEMMRGMAYAAVFVFGVGFLLYVIHLVGMLLPEESKNAPSPYSFYQEQPAQVPPSAFG